MSSPFYFFDQFSSGSHLGGVYRVKRNSKDLNHALYHVKSMLIAEDASDNKSITTTPNPIQKSSDNTNLQKLLLRQSKSPIQPEMITRELDTIFQCLNEKSKIIAPSSPPKSPQQSLINNEDELIDTTSKLSAISLPSSLILRLHSTWSDLIKNTEYKYKIWRTKAGEHNWCQYVQQKRSKQLKSEKQRFLNDEKTTSHRRQSSRISVASLTKPSHRQSLTAHAQIHGSQSPTRTSFLNTNGMTQDNLRLFKAIHQGTLENTTESNKHGLHVEFKLSTQIDKITQKIPTNKHKIALIDVSKAEVNVDDEILISVQNKCKCLLAETKQKILATTNDLGIKQSKISRLWFYGDNQYIRNKNHFSASNHQQKSKFALAILRREMPEKYNINTDIFEAKQKCYIEFKDGSSQIYYPSGRLAVLRLRSSHSITLFFDDTNTTTKQFLGLATSTGNVIAMQPTFHARFISNNQHEYAYLCHGKTGIIEKQLEWFPKNKSRQVSPTIVEDDNNQLSLYENSVQLQLNSSMQLECNNPMNIRFAFTCQNEEFKFQLGIPLPIQSPSLTDSTKIRTRKLSEDKKFPTKRTSSIISNDSINVSERHQMQSQRSADEQADFYQLPIMRELTILRKHIKYICDSWLKEYRTTLGVLDIDAYCLSDLPPPTPEPTSDRNQDENSKQFEPLLTRRTSLSNNLIKSIDKQQLSRRSGKITQSNVITDSIEQFVPRSNAGQAIKQRIYAKNNGLCTTLPIIKSH